jgi:uncharacterized protein YcbK (DUF882 family)
MIPVRAFSAMKYKEIKRGLCMHNIHTGSTIKTNFWHHGRYDFSSLKKINFFLRDHRSNEVRSISLHLLELLYELKQLLGHTRPFDVISGYRSPKTNAKLRRVGRGVAKNSYHMKGMAIDINFRGLSLMRARKAACFLRRGGVGYYPSSHFIHVDVRGNPTHWSG